MRESISRMVSRSERLFGCCQRRSGRQEKVRLREGGVLCCGSSGENAVAFFSQADVYSTVRQLRLSPKRRDCSASKGME